jgi:quercetin dioxygenase-like cupin family protein
VADDAAAALAQSPVQQKLLEIDLKGTLMIHKGAVIENPVTGERLRFLETSQETNGEYVLVECTVQPSGFVAAAHVHPRQTERFEIEAGVLGFRVDGNDVLARAGDTIVVEPGSAHKFWNAGDTEARFVCEVRPALQFERLLETMFALANDGRTNRNGMPNPLRLAVIANAHFEDVRLPFPPAWLQKAGLALGAPLGRLLGYRPEYDGAAPDDVALAL